MAFTPVPAGWSVEAVLSDVLGAVAGWRTGVVADVRRLAREHGLELDAGAWAS